MSWGSEYEARERKEKPMRRIHISTSVRGLLNLHDKDLEGIAPFVIVDGNRLKTAQELRYFLEKELAKGHELIAADGCDNFDPKKGCLGHEVEEEDHANSESIPAPDSGDANG